MTHTYIFIYTYTYTYATMDGNIRQVWSSYECLNGPYIFSPESGTAFFPSDVVQREWQTIKEHAYMGKKTINLQTTEKPTKKRILTWCFACRFIVVL